MTKDSAAEVRVPTNERSGSKSSQRKESLRLNSKGIESSTPRTPRLAARQTSGNGGSDQSDTDTDGDYGPSMQELTDMPKETFTVPNETWGVGIFVIVKDLGDILTGGARRVQVIRFSFSVFCLLLNICIQIGLIVFCDEFIVAGSVKTIQTDYKQYHMEVFDDAGEFVQEKWDKFGLRESLCQAGMTKMFFLSSILFLWGTRMLGELRATRRLNKHIGQLPALPWDGEPHDMVVEDESGEVPSYHIICLTTMTRFLLRILIIVPKLGIGTYLLFMGWKFLAASEGFADIIMNALALEFIIDIDELVFECLFPESIAVTMDNTCFALPKKFPTAEEKEHAVTADYYRSLFFIAVLMTSVLLYITWGQQVIPGYTSDIGDHCNEYLEAELTPPCNKITLAPFMTNDCFPFGSSID